MRLIFALTVTLMTESNVALRGGVYEPSGRGHRIVFRSRLYGGFRSTDFSYGDNLGIIRTYLPRVSHFRKKLPCSPQRGTKDVYEAPHILINTRLGARTRALPNVYFGWSHPLLLQGERVSL